MFLFKSCVEKEINDCCKSAVIVLVRLQPSFTTLTIRTTRKIWKNGSRNMEAGPRSGRFTFCDAIPVNQTDEASFGILIG